MKLYSIESGNFKLDGGAMFGVVPKSIWSKTNPADSNNMIDLATRCLLIEDGKPIYREDGKVMKGPNYFKPDFSRILEK